MWAVPRRCARWGAAAAFALLLVAAAPASGIERVWQPPQILNPDPANNWTNDPVMVRTATGETVTAFLSLPNEGWTTRVLVRVRNVDGTLGPVEELSDYPAGCVLDIATDALGNVVVSWMRPDGSGQIARRPPGGKFGEPETISPGYESNGMPALTMNARGDIGLVWKTRDSDAPGAATHVQARVAPRGKPFGPIHDLSEPESPGYWGGVDGALTPDGDLVALWTDTPVDERDERPTHVRATTLFEDGRVNPVQELSTFQGWALCPQVLSDLRGRVAALWTEIYDDYCPIRGRLMLALRKNGDRFDPPQEVPGTRGAATPGDLAVSDGGQIGVAFSGGYGLQSKLAVGSFDEPLQLVAGFEDSGKPLISGGEAGEIVFGPNWQADIVTGRMRPDGSFAPPQDLREDCAEVAYSVMDVNDDGAAAVASLMPWTGELELVADAPSAFAGPLRCDPDKAPGPPPQEPPPYVPPTDPPQDGPPQEPELPPAPPPSEGPAADPQPQTGGPAAPPAESAPSQGAAPPAYGPRAGGPAPAGFSPAETGFDVVVDAVRRSGSVRKRTVKLRVRCGVACSLNALGLVTSSKDGRVLSRASAQRVARDGTAWIKLRFKLPSKLSASKRRRAMVRIAAADAHGNYLQRDLRVDL